MLARVLILSIAAAGFAGCATQTTVELPVVDMDALRVQAEAPRGADAPDDFLEVGGIWRAIALERRVVPVGAPAAPRTASHEDVVLPGGALPKPDSALERLIARGRGNAPPARELAVPKRRSAKPRREQGQASTRTADQLAREHFLDFPTKIVAKRILLFVPAPLVHELRLTGRDLHSTGPGRRTARGQARLVLRELTIEAEQIKLRVRPDPMDDLQISARGDVAFASQVRQQVVRHQGLRAILLTNDQLVPLP